jgi:6-phosphogluconolactonase (cycloisomerase 2 family)
MRIRLAWIVAILAVVAIGFLMACSTKYSASSNGLVVVPSQNLFVMSSFSINLSNGEVSQIYNNNGPITNGLPTSVVVDPSGQYAFVIVVQNPAVSIQIPSILGGGVTGVEAYQIASDGKLANITTVQFNPESIYLSGSTTPEMVPVVPAEALAIDSAGKFLFVADSATVDGSGNQIPGAVSVFSISNGTPTEVPGSPFVLPVNGNASGNPGPCGSQVLCSNASALAVTPTVYPVLYSYCSATTPPTTENLYVTDAANYVVLNYSVDPSAGTLSLVPAPAAIGVPTGTVPSGVAVDPCNRFVYVSNQTPDNSVSAYTICNTVSNASNCPVADFRLHPVTGKLFLTGDDPGPLAVDAYGKFLYVVDTGANELSAFEVNPSTGSLTPFNQPTISTGLGPNAISIRSDDSWVFVANFNSNTLSQYAIVPATGALVPTSQPVSTFNYPSGVAVR